MVMDYVPMHLLINIILFITASCQSSQPNITSSSEKFCLGDLVVLNCSAQNAIIWSSESTIGRGRGISFDSSDEINLPKMEGNATGILFQTNPLLISSLSFNLTADRVQTNCTDSQFTSTTEISSVYPSPSNISVWIQTNSEGEGDIIIWSPPDNIGDFCLQIYQLKIECNEAVVESINTTETSYSYDEGKLDPGLCKATVRVINTCGDTSSNSVVFKVIIRKLTEHEKRLIGLGIVLGLGIPVLMIIFSVIVIRIVVYYYKKKMNKINEEIQELSRCIEEMNESLSQPSERNNNILQNIKRMKETFLKFFKKKKEETPELSQPNEMQKNDNV